MNLEEGLGSSGATTGGRTDASALLVVEQISKSFGHVQALKRVSFDVGSGEVVGLLGDNGAGKSTMIKILSGVYQPDSGTIRRHGLPIQLNGPSAARLHGIATVFQDLRLVDTRSVAHNIFLGREPRRARISMDRKRMERGTEELEHAYLGYARTIFPDLRDDEIISKVVQRARVTEPVHLVGGAKRLPEMFSVPGLSLASTAHVYPEIVSGQAVIGVSDTVVPRILERLPAEQRAAA